MTRRRGSLLARSFSTAAVIDNDYLVVICDTRRHLHGLVNQPGYRVFVIECGEEDTDAVRSVVRFLMGVHWKMAERKFYKPNPSQSRLIDRCAGSCENFSLGCL